MRRLLAVPVDGGANVVVVEIEPLYPLQLSRTCQLRGRLLGQGQEVGGMALANLSHPW